MFGIFLTLGLAATGPQFADFFIGTYTIPDGSKGIYRARLNLQSGEISQPELAIETADPSFLALSPNGRFLYAVDETAFGRVNAFAVGPDLALTLLNGQSSEGNGPCHVAVTPDGKNVLVANYGSGSSAMLPVGADGTLGKATSTFQDNGTGPNHARQEAPHMHSMYTDVKGRFIFACDLGDDRLLVHRTDTLNAPQIVAMAPGSGPRHTAQSQDGRFIYVMNEMGNSVTVLSAARDGKLTEIQTIKSLPADQTAHDIRSAEIEIHKNGKWLYASNRGYDSIAQFSIGRDGKLALAQIVPSPVAEPRSFAVDPSGKWMVVSGQSGNGIAVMAIDPKTGALSPHGPAVPMSAPVCILFVNHR